MKKQIPNMITMIRIVGAFMLLVMKPFSRLFYSFYSICGISDILDGYLARKFKLASKTGQVLDSIADAIFVAVVLIVMLPSIKLPVWALLWIMVIAFIRCLSLIVGFLRYHSFSSLHTYANKITGAVLFILPILFPLVGLEISIIIGCSVSSISSMEELYINMKAKELNRDAKGRILWGLKY